MTGDHRSGWEASRCGLFRNAPVYLCPTRESNERRVDAASALARARRAPGVHVGGGSTIARLAWTSHLPHMVSTSLALALADAGVDRDYLGPGGRDTTRLAGSSPEMWTAIALENATRSPAALTTPDEKWPDTDARRFEKPSRSRCERDWDMLGPARTSILEEWRAGAWVRREGRGCSVEAECIAATISHFPL